MKQIDIYLLSVPTVHCIVKITVVYAPTMHLTAANCSNEATLWTTQD